MYKFVLTLLVLVAALGVVACGDDDDAGDDAAVETSPAASAEATDDSGTSGTGSASAETFTSSRLPISVTVSPGEGWTVPDDADLVDLFAVIQTDSPLGYVDFVQPTQVYNYASESESALAEPPADYVQWFNDNPFAVVSATEEVTVGGLEGTRLTIANPDNESFSLFKLSAGDYHLSYADQNYAYILNSGEEQILAICGTDNPRDFSQFQTACEEALATAEFGG